MIRKALHSAALIMPRFCLISLCTERGIALSRSKQAKYNEAPVSLDSAAQAVPPATVAAPLGLAAAPPRGAASSEAHALAQEAVQLKVQAQNFKVCFARTLPLRGSSSLSSHICIGMHCFFCAGSTWLRRGHATK